MLIPLWSLSLHDFRHRLEVWTLKMQVGFTVNKNNDIKQNRVNLVSARLVEAEQFDWQNFQPRQVSLRLEYTWKENEIMHWMSAWKTPYWSVCSFVRSFVRLFVRSFVRLFVCLFDWLFVCLMFYDQLENILLIKAFVNKHHEWSLIGCFVLFFFVFYALLIVFQPYSYPHARNIALQKRRIRRDMK